MTGSIQAIREGDRVVLTAGGAWLVDQVQRLATMLGRLPPQLDGVRTVTLDLTGLDRVDTNGAWLLVRTERQLRDAGRQVTVRLPRADKAARLLTYVQGIHPPTVQPRVRRNQAFVLLDRIGRSTYAVAAEGVGILAFYGEILLRTLYTAVHPRRIRWTSFASHVEQVGLGAVPITALLSFLIGLVMAWQGAGQLRRFGADIFAVDLLTIAVLRELGVLLTAIIVAGRTASAFTAQIGSMVLNEEVDAMRIIGIDPVDTLVLPRFFALLISLPILTFIANASALMGGAVVVLFELNIPASQMLARFGEVAAPAHFAVGMVKAPVFAFVVALIGCWNGLQVERNAESVGRMTTRSVVASIFLVIIVDALFSILFVRLGI